MKILDFFQFLWVIFALLDPVPDPVTQINADPCGSGSETLPVATELVMGSPVFRRPYLFCLLYDVARPSFLSLAFWMLA